MFIFPHLIHEEIFHMKRQSADALTSEIRIKFFSSSFLKRNKEAKKRIKREIRTSRNAERRGKKTYGESAHIISAGALFVIVL
jgi:hypothetical protein